MKDNLTELFIILDRSGSMQRLTADTIGGYNSLIEQQRKLEGEMRVTTVLFDDEYDLLYDTVDINEIPPLTEDTYFARGSTALLDAVGKTIDAAGLRYSRMFESDRPSKVIFAITTDGMENASREYTLERVKNLIEQKKEKYGWEFLFFGANIDAFGAARSMGISAHRTMQFSHDAAGVETCFRRMSFDISEMRTSSLRQKEENDD